MKPYYDNLVVPSYILWLDNVLLKEAEAYYNYNDMPLFLTGTRRVTSTATYNSPFRQWVADSSASGANIPSGIAVDSFNLNRGISGLKIDYNNGRVFTDSLLNGNTIKVNAAVKEFNIYPTDKPEEDILFETKFIPQEKWGRDLRALPKDYATYPAIFVRYESRSNDAFVFGNEITQNNFQFRAIVLSDDAYKLDNVCGRMRDKKHTYFHYFGSPNELPYDYYGDVKSGLNYVYNYDTIMQSGNCDVFIEDVSISKFNESVNTEIAPNLFGAFIDFECQSWRNISQ